MTWQRIRLELAETRDFPRGSASRVYLLRLPLDPCGAIDSAALSRLPHRATVRRFWPSQADLSGHVIPAAGGWAFVYGRSEPVRQPVIPAFRSGGEVVLAEPDGTALPFRVARLEQLN
ncbi:hypothetical protein WG901_12060 [Novosphingobium sp. PS1R-30]|uniref:RES domain-containing protein n=1 Tax=Novosphingobium anseongense TaxID=3133436 RepID=A0ABU8RWB7_9SPHN